MNKCPQCGEPVPKEKAFCDNCAKTLFPKKAKKGQPSEWEVTTTIPARPSKRKRKSSKTDSSKKPNVLDVYWEKRQRRDEE